MKSECLFREDDNSPIFSGMYDFDSGTIEGIPTSKFQCKLQSYFFSEYEQKSDTLSIGSTSYLNYVLRKTNGFLAVNFYDVGVLAVGKVYSGIIFYVDNSFKSFDDVIEKGAGVNLFDYHKNRVGLFSPRLTDFDVVKNINFLYVDDDFLFLSDKGTSKTNLDYLPSEDEISKIPSLIPTIRKGYDGVLVCKKDEYLPYKLEDIILK